MAYPLYANEAPIESCLKQGQATECESSRSTLSRSTISKLVVFEFVGFKLRAIDGTDYTLTRLKRNQRTAIVFINLWLLLR